MDKEELEVLEDISKIQSKQRLLLSKPKNSQQELLQVYGQRFLLSKKVLHRNIEEVTKYLPGTFGATALRLSYMSVCLDNSIELPLDQYPVLKMLVDWSDFLHSPEAKSLSLNELVFQNREPTVFDSHEEYSAYLNLIANDLAKWPQTKRAPTDDLLSFVHAALPKILYNMLIPKHLVPSIAGEKPNVEVLFKHRSWEYFHRSKPSLAQLLRTILGELVSRQLGETEQRRVMEIILRYFYAYHHDKRYQSTDLFIQGFNQLSESARTDLTDEFILFFRIARKIGKARFVDFLVSKSQWVKETLARVEDSALVGYPKDALAPYNTAGLSELVQVGPGKTEYRYLEVVEDLSMVYFGIEALSLDITVRLFYEGAVQGKPANTMLNEIVKNSGEYRSNFMALKRGIYKFELDNSYSWINSKTVRVEFSVLEPVEIKSSQPNSWGQGYYGSLPTNTLSEPFKLQVVQLREAQNEEREGQTDGKAAITKNGRFFNVKVTKPKSIYEFETENEDKFVQRCVHISQQEQHLAWTLFGEVLSDSRELGSQLTGKKAPKEKPAMKQQKKVQQIEASFEEDDEGEE